MIKIGSAFTDLDSLIPNASVMLTQVYAADDISYVQSGHFLVSRSASVGPGAMMPPPSMPSSAKCYYKRTRKGDIDEKVAECIHKGSESLFDS